MSGAPVDGLLCARCWLRRLRPARRLRAGFSRDCDVCSEMVPLPEGDVALGRFEVTLDEYRAFAEASPDAAWESRCLGRHSWRDPGYLQTGRHAVACVSWNEAQAYAEWLSLKTRRQYRLPTEAEWDRGAAGSPKGCYWPFRGERGNLRGRLLPPEPAGLFDMVGNLWEWTDSCWDGDCSQKVTRGADWGEPGLEDALGYARVGRPRPPLFQDRLPGRQNSTVTRNDRRSR